MICNGRRVRAPLTAHLKPQKAHVEFEGGIAHCMQQLFIWGGTAAAMIPDRGKRVETLKTYLPSKRATHGRANYEAMVPNRGLIIEA